MHAYDASAELPNDLQPTCDAGNGSSSSCMLWALGSKHIFAVDASEGINDLREEAATRIQDSYRTVVKRSLPSESDETEGKNACGECGMLFDALQTSDDYTDRSDKYDKCCHTYCSKLPWTAKVGIGAHAGKS